MLSAIWIGIFGGKTNDKSFKYTFNFTGSYWTFSISKDELLLSIAYLCFIFSLLAVIPTNKKRLFSLLYGLLISMILILLIQAEILVNPYEQLLNI